MGRRAELRVYASSMKRDISAEAMKQTAFLKGLRDRDGYDAFKFRVGAECGRDVDEWPGRTEEIVPTVRKALGDDVDVAGRCEQRLLTQARAIEVGRMLAATTASRHYEEPCPYWEIEQTRKRLRDALSTSTSPAASRTATFRSGVT